MNYENSKFENKVKNCYDNNKQLWVCYKDPVLVYLKTSNFFDIFDVTHLQSNLSFNQILYVILDQTLPDLYLKPKSIYHGIEKMSIQLPSEYSKILAEISKKAKNVTSRVSTKIQKEINQELRAIENILKFPDPIKWAEKTYKLYGLSVSEKILSEKRRKNGLIDVDGKLNKDVVNFILKYWGDERICKNVFFIVFSSINPIVKHENWEIYLYS